MDSYDVIVLGAGSAAEWLWPGITDRSIAVIERNRVGGDCPYVACMPSKAMLRAAHARHEFGRAVLIGATSHPLTLDDDVSSYEAAVHQRDVVAEHRSDRDVAKRLEQAGAHLYRGKGVVVRPGVVRVGDLEIGYQDLVINTGAVQRFPPIKGLSDVALWTSEDAMTLADRPTSLAIIGGGAIGCELAQIYSAFGTQVTLLEMAPQLLPAEEPAVAAALAETLTSDGIAVFTNVSIARVATAGSAVLLELGDGRHITASRLLVAAGRTPNVTGIGLETLGIDVSSGRLEVEPSLQIRGQQHVWAAGDVTGIAPFTHTANHHGRVLSVNLAGGSATAVHDAIPRCVFTDPPVASVGMTEKRARDAGHDVIVAQGSTGATARARAESRTCGVLVLLADRATGLLLGAAAIGAAADEWIGEACLAMQASIPITVWAEVVHPFPTYSEVYEGPLRELSEALRRT